MTDKTDLARPYHYEPYPAKPNNASSLKRNEIKTSSNASSLIHNPTKHKSERSSKCCCCTISSRSATFWTSFLTNLGICTLLFGYTLLGEFSKKRDNLRELFCVVANLLVFVATDCCWLSVMCEVSHSHSKWNEVSGEHTFKLVELNYSSRANGESGKFMHSIHNNRKSLLAANCTLVPVHSFEFISLSLLNFLSTQDRSSFSPSRVALHKCSRGRSRRQTVNRKPHNHREITMWILWIIIVIIQAIRPSHPAHWRTLPTFVIDV